LGRDQDVARVKVGDIFNFDCGITTIVHNHSFTTDVSFLWARMHGDLKRSKLVTVFLSKSKIIDNIVRNLGNLGCEFNFTLNLFFFFFRSKINVSLKISLNLIESKLELTITISTSINVINCCLE
jgi:hypothetical protein